MARGAVAPLAALFAADTFQGSSSISAEAGERVDGGPMLHCQMSNGKNLGWLGCIGDEKLPNFNGDFYKPI